MAENTVAENNMDKNSMDKGSMRHLKQTKETYQPFVFYTDLNISEHSKVILLKCVVLVSSALFIAVTFLYERHHTRLVRYYRGMVITMPLFGTLMLALVLANASIPLSCNFVGKDCC